MSVESRKIALERKIKNAERVIEKQTGTGLFVYRNMTHADIGLPKPGMGGERYIGPGKTFQGDSYFRSVSGLQIVTTIKPMGVPTYDVPKEQPVVQPNVEEVKSESESKLESEPEKANDTSNGLWKEASSAANSSRKKDKKNTGTDATTTDGISGPAYPIN